MKQKYQLKAKLSRNYENNVVTLFSYHVTWLSARLEQLYHFFLNKECSSVVLKRISLK